MKSDELLTKIYQIVYQTQPTPEVKLETIASLIKRYKDADFMKWKAEEELNLYTHGAICGIPDDNHYRE